MEILAILLIAGGIHFASMEMKIKNKIPVYNEFRSSRGRSVITSASSDKLGARCNLSRAQLAKSNITGASAIAAQAPPHTNLDDKLKGHTFPEGSVLEALQDGKINEDSCVTVSDCDIFRNQEFGIGSQRDMAPTNFNEGTDVFDWFSGNLQPFRQKTDDIRGPQFETPINSVEQRATCSQFEKDYTFSAKGYRPRFPVHYNEKGEQTTNITTRNPKLNKVLNYYAGQLSRQFVGQLKKNYDTPCCQNVINQSFPSASGFTMSMNVSNMVNREEHRSLENVWGASIGSDQIRAEMGVGAATKLTDKSLMGHEAAAVPQFGLNSAIGLQTGLIGEGSDIPQTGGNRNERHVQLAGNAVRTAAAPLRESISGNGEPVYGRVGPPGLPMPRPISQHVAEPVGGTDYPAHQQVYGTRSPFR